MERSVYEEAGKGPRVLEGSTQEFTFALSIGGQIITFALGVVSLAQQSLGETLQLILVLEVLVQGVEFGFYLIVGLRYLFWKSSTPLVLRYADWVFSTPLQLIGLFFFVLWSANRDCIKNDDLASNGSRVAAIVVVILFDWIMLGFGAIFELSDVGNTVAQRWASAVQQFVGGNRKIAVATGFLPFFAAFTPILVALGTAYSDWGLVSVLITMTSWAGYGFVAIFVESEERKNSILNILDLVSKNLVGVIISGIALGYTAPSSTLLNCSLT
jgi:hypothetical protein